MTDPAIPDKCEFCGLRVFYRDAPIDRLIGRDVDSDFVKLHELKRLGIIKDVPPRKLSVTIGPAEPGSTAFCAINASAWKNKQQPCEHWTLKIKNATVADYLAMYQASKNNLLALGIAIVAIAISVIVAIVD